MSEYTLYLTKATYKFSEKDLDYLAKGLEIVETSLDENGEKVPFAGWKGKNGYCYFFKKQEIFESDLNELKTKGLVLVIGLGEVEKMEKNLDLSQFLVEII